MAEPCYRRGVRSRASLALFVIALAACRRTHVPPTVTAPPSAPAVEEPEVAAAPPAPPVEPRATSTARQPAPAPIVTTAARDGGTVNGDANGPRAEALNQVVAAAQPSLQACLDGTELAPGAELDVTVSYKIMNDGRTVGVEVAAAGASREAIDCMRRVADGLRFPPFGGEPVSGSFPYRYRR